MSSPDQKTTPRRSFLKTLWAVLGLAALGEILWVVFSFFKPVKKKSDAGSPKALIDAGTIDAYEKGSVSAFVTGRFYLVRLEDGGILAVSAKCTHLGCSVPWEEGKKQFICPCHSSIFDITGSVVSSPAPRALDLHPVSITNQQIFVDISKSLQRNRFSKSQAVYPDRVTVAGEKDSRT